MTKEADMTNKLAMTIVLGGLMALAASGLGLCVDRKTTSAKARVSLISLKENARPERL